MNQNDKPLKLWFCNYDNGNRIVVIAGSCPKACRLLQISQSYFYQCFRQSKHPRDVASAQRQGQSMWERVKGEWKKVDAPSIGLFQKKREGLLRTEGE